jgi:hypothetical protein
MVRQKIQASAILNKMEAHIFEKCSCYHEDEEKQRRCSVSDPSGAKISMYLLSQSIGNPPQEINGEVTVTANVVVQALVARLGPERARQALEIQAPGLVALLQAPIEAEYSE